MSNTIVPNPPSFESLQHTAKDHKANSKKQRFPTTMHLRTALEEVPGNRELYAKLCKYYSQGNVSGCIQADCYFFANELVAWEAEAGRHSLRKALESGEIRLVDIVKRLAPEIKKQLKLDVQRGTITGYLPNSPALEQTATLE